MNDVMVLDVETTGLSRRNDIVTTACWHYHGTWYRWVRGIDSANLFQSHWADCSELVTFNGRQFDEKFVVKDLGVQTHSRHRDVMYDGWKRGCKGGLKKVAESCGLPRPPEIRGMDGRAAITLWNYWRAGDAQALELLSLYNAWDVWLTLCLYRRFVLDLPPDTDHGIPWKLDRSAARRLLAMGGPWVEGPRSVRYNRHSREVRDGIIQRQHCRQDPGHGQVRATGLVHSPGCFRDIHDLPGHGVLLGRSLRG